MQPEQERVTSYFCAECGCLLLGNLRITQNSKLARARLYCATCYWNLKQQVEQLQTRLRMVEHG